MFNFIKNAINIENISINKKQQKEEISNFLDLTYNIETIEIFNENNLPKLNPYSFYSTQYKEILDKILPTFDNLFSKLYSNKIIIKNTGSTPITYNDFYKNDKLGFSNSRSIVSVMVNASTTRKYIDTKLNVNENFINIEFDTIEPKDFIELNVISYQSMEYCELTGKTKDFDKPHKLSNTKNLSNISRSNIILNITIVLLVALYFLLFVFGEYLEHKKLGLYIRNPFVIQEVQKDVK